MRAKSAGSIFALVHAWVKKVPRGKVVTYGQLSDLVGGRLSPLAIGWALRAKQDLPWQRVVNAKGGISTDGDVPGLQRRLLEKEGVRFGPDGRIDLDRYRWHPRRL